MRKHTCSTKELDHTLPMELRLCFSDPVQRVFFYGIKKSLVTKRRIMKIRNRLGKRGSGEIIQHLLESAEGSAAFSEIFRAVCLLQAKGIFNKKVTPPEAVSRILI